MHKHTCLECDAVIAEGDFHCEFDTNHGYALCDECARAHMRQDKAGNPARGDNMETFDLYARIIHTAKSRWFRRKKNETREQFNLRVMTAASKLGHSSYVIGWWPSYFEAVKARIIP